MKEIDQDNNPPHKKAEGPGEVGKEYLEKVEANKSFLPTPPKNRPKNSKLTIMIVGKKTFQTIVQSLR